MNSGAKRDILRTLLEEQEVKSAIRCDLPAASPGEEKFLGVLRGYVSLMTSAVAKLLERYAAGSANGAGGAHTAGRSIEVTWPLSARFRKNIWTPG